MKSVSPPPIRVPSDFEREFPGASRSAAEVAANLIRVAADFETQVERRIREIAGLSTSGQQTLAILEGAGEPLAGHVIAERLLVRSASMTSLLDTLEGRGLIERHPHPTDRRKILIHLTDQGHMIVDQTLPALHAIFTAAIRDLSESDRAQLITSLTTLRTRLHELADQPAPTSKGRRKRRPDGRLSAREGARQKT
jgi:DNA-binding MarR family transcriptional regulator